jgi:uncharacterized protein
MIKVRCPICQRVLQGQSTAEWPQYPFCSDRCRLIDLGRWLGEDYRFAADAEDEATPQEGDTSLPP